MTCLTLSSTLIKMFDRDFVVRIYHFICYVLVFFLIAYHHTSLSLADKFLCEKISSFQHNILRRVQVALIIRMRERESVMSMN